MKLYYTIHGSSGIPVYEIQIPYVDSVWTDENKIVFLRHSGVMEILPFDAKYCEFELYA